MTVRAALRRWSRRPGVSALALLALFVVALVLGRVVTDQLSDSQASAAPFPVRGAVSDGPVRLGYAEVAVAGVRATDTLVSGDEPEATTEVFLIVDLELVATERPLTISGLRLRGEDGTVYQPTDRGGCGTGASLSTGVTTYLMGCFEIPKGAVPGATVLVGRGNPDSELDRREQKAEIDLEIDAGLAADLITRDEPLPAAGPDIRPYEMTMAEEER